MSAVLSLAGMLAVGAAFYLIAQKNFSASELRSEVVFRKEQAEKLQLLQRAAAETEGKRARLASYFVSSADTAKFLDGIEELGRRSGAKFAVTSAEWNKTADKPVSLSISFAAAGSFAELYKLLLLLENAPFEAVITKASIKKGIPLGIGKDLPIPWEGNFSLNIFSVE